RLLGDRDCGLETVERRIAVRVQLIRATDPAEQRRGKLAVLRSLERVQGALVQRARVVAPSLAFSELGLLDQCLDRGLHRRSDLSPAGGWSNRKTKGEACGRARLPL